MPSITRKLRIHSHYTNANELGDPLQDLIDNLLIQLSNGDTARAENVLQQLKEYCCSNLARAQSLFVSAGIGRVIVEQRKQYQRG